MLNFSDEFKNGTAKISKIWLDFTLEDGTVFECHEDRVGFNGFTRDTSTTVGSEFTVGSAVTGEMTCTLNNYDDALSGYDFRNATIVAWLGGYRISDVTRGLHPDEDIIATDEFTITGLTANQLALFTVNAMIAFGMTDRSQDIAVTTITSVSTTDNVTRVTVANIMSVPSTAYIATLVEEKVNVGRYYVDEYKYSGANINITAYDDMVKFDLPCENITWGSGKTIADLVDNALFGKDLSLWNASLPSPSEYIITQKPKQWDTMTWHDVIAYCAQIMCCFAKIVYTPNPGAYQLKFDWYDTGAVGAMNYDGGTFNTNTIPYSDGATLDGGSFNPWDTGAEVDGGIFGDRSNLHILGVPYSITVDTDDVLITGTSVTLAVSDNIAADDDTTDFTFTAGSEGYIIKISGNPLIETTDQARIVCQYINSCIEGMRFRPLSASCPDNPSMEAGDTAFVADRKDNLYACILSRVAYTMRSQTQINCDAASPMQNLKSRYTGEQKVQAMLNRVFDRSVSSSELAMSGIMGALATTMGLNYFPDIAEDGSTIYRFGNGPSIEQSDIQWRFSAGAVMVSSDGGQHWNGAFSSEGIAVLQEVYAVKVNADNIETGTLTLGGNNNASGTMRVLNANGTEIGKWDKDGIEAINLTAYGSLICYENYTIS